MCELQNYLGELVRQGNLTEEGARALMRPHTSEHSVSCALFAWSGAMERSQIGKVYGLTIARMRRDGR